ncbi:hypothetical protein JL720_9604 [Aureococcus anophagefferens]|nr:hypothetical protein JL720_9604 [Aureococcus anophagefferens]
MIPAAAAAAIMDHGFLADWSAFAMTCHKVARQVAERREILLRRDPSFPDDEFFALPAVRRRLRAVLRRSLSLAVLERGIKAMSAKLGPERVETEPVYEELFVRPALVDVPQHEDPRPPNFGVGDTHRRLGVRLASGGETTLRVLRPTAAATCALSGAKIDKFAVRLAVVVPKHNGEPDWGIFRLHEARAFMRALRAEPGLEHFDVADVRGVASSRPSTATGPRGAPRRGRAAEPH